MFVNTNHVLIIIISYMFIVVTKKQNSLDIKSYIIFHIPHPQGVVPGVGGRVQEIAVLATSIPVIADCCGYIDDDTMPCGYRCRRCRFKPQGAPCLVMVLFTYEDGAIHI